MAGYYCPSVVRSCMVRITRNDACGTPVAATTAKSRLMFTAFGQLNLSPVYEQGDENVVKDACGRVVIDDVACDQLKRFDGTLKLAGTLVTPLLEMVVGGRPLMGDEAATSGTLTTAYGLALPAFRGDVCEDENFTVEVWARNSAPAACVIGSALRYMQFALTKTNHWKLTNGLNFDGKPQELEFAFQAHPNPNWAPPVAAEWATADAITELFAYRMKTAIPTSGVTGLPLGQCNFEPAAA